MKRVLMLSSVASSIDQFNMQNIRLLQNLGYVVDVACNFKKGNTTSDDRVAEFKGELKALRVRYYHVDFARNPLDIWQNLATYKQLNKIFQQNKYEFIHCQTPIGGIMGRMLGHKYRTKVIYAAHGLHFFKGAPLINWLFYYPVEWMFSWWTDVLIATNKEDYRRAKRNLHARRVAYVPGVGINVDKIKKITVDRKEKRRELGVPEDAFVLLSVGELNKNKNHQIIIRSLATIGDKEIYYLIAGKGVLEKELEKLAAMLGVEKRVHLLGYRTDVIEICKAADVFCFPSKREGLGLAALEAMCSGLPLLTSDVHGILDYSKNGVTGYLCSPDNIEGFAESITILMSDSRLREKIAKHNINAVEQYDVGHIIKLMRRLYNKVVGEGD